MGANEEWESAVPVSEWDSATPVDESSNEGLYPSAADVAEARPAQPAFMAGKGGGYDEVELAPTVKPQIELSEAKDPNQTVRQVPNEEAVSRINTLGAFKEAAKHPVATVADPSKRREIERGVSDVATLGMAEKLANALSPDLAASAEPDASKAPGFRSMGDVAGTALPSVHGYALGKVIGAGAKGVAKFAKGAQRRGYVRGAENVVEGSRGNARKAMPSDDKALHRAMEEEPELLAAANTKDPEKVLAAADNLAKKGSTELKQIYKESNKIPEKGLATDIVAQAEDAELRAVHLERELQGMPQGSDAFKKGKTALDVLRGEASSLRRDAYNQIISKRAPGVDPKQATTNMDVRISALKAGNANDRAVAKKLEEIRNDFHENVGSKDIVPAEKLRAEQSAYQENAYSKNPLKDPNLTVAIAANAEAQRAVGDVVVKHVTGLDYKAAKELALSQPDSIAGKLFKANERVNVANRIKASIKSKQGGNPGAPHGMSRLIHGATHAGAAMGATAAHMMGHSKVAAGIAAVDIGIAAAPHVARGVDKLAIGLAKLNNKPASDTIKKYAEKMISLGVATKSIDKAVAKLNKEVEPTEE